MDQRGPRLNGGSKKIKRGAPFPPPLAVAGEEAQQSSLLLRARRATLVVIGPCTMEGCCTDERALSFGARPWYDVPAVASNAKPATACEASTRAPALAVAGEDRARGSVVYEFWRVGYAPLRRLMTRAAAGVRRR